MPDERIVGDGAGNRVDPLGYGVHVTTSVGPGGWQSSEVLAYTERDGPGRPPAGPPRWLVGSLAGFVGVGVVAMMATDTLCPEHRQWVMGLASIGLICIGGALVALWRGMAGAPTLTVVAGLSGVAIGWIDTVHSDARGVVIMIVFALVTGLGVELMRRARALARWEQAAAAELTSAPIEERSIDTGDLAVADVVAAPVRPAQPVDLG
jgi:hypothetical protein